MAEVDPAWWRTPLAVLRLAAGSLFAALILLGAFLVIAEGPGIVRAVVFGGGALGVVAFILGWGMKGLWPRPGQVVQLATVVVLPPVAYLAALDAYGMAETTTLVLFAATILLVAVPVALRVRRNDPPLKSQGTTGDELVLMAAVGWAGVIIFGALALWVARGLTGRAIITADADGVTDRSRIVGWGQVDWDEVARFTSATRGVAVIPRHPHGFVRRTPRRRIQMRLGASVDGILLSTILVSEDRWLATGLLEGARRRWQTR